MQTVLQLGFTTLQLAAVYVLFSLGLTLIFGVMRIVNFAHGHSFTLAAMTVALLAPWFIDSGLPVSTAYLLASGVGILAALALGLVIFRFGLRYFQRDFHGAFILTLGIALLLDGAILSAFGGTVRPVPEIFEGTATVLGVRISTERLVLGLAAVIISAALYFALASSKLGRALRAVAADHEAAMLQGIPYNRLALIGFLIATALAAIAGVLTAPIASVSPVLGTDYLLKGFIAVIIGGLGSVPGAIVGGLFISAVETVGGFYYGASSATILSFVLVIVVLLARPRGLFGNG
ncbi:branched-chain amino acid ABC transporter permease [Paracoccus sp. J39]|uniref:branched-chain amino acid ABC transporter permease n=1 Tax=Paracoccus sp. J39 TaxID=935848 RepID=UPI0004918706|nr:branched-chain amino acid ABC transporter permease [Paracoccus sp. J39]